jgi:hypothetical protein
MGSIKTKVIILIAVFLVTAFLGRIFSRSHHDASVEKNATKLLECDAAKVRRIELNRDESLVFERTDQESERAFQAHVLDLIQWQMRAPAAHEADVARVSKIASLACETYSPEPESKAEAQGVAFDGPSVFLSYGDSGQKFELHFAKKIESRKAFVRTGNGRVYRLSENFYHLLTAPTEAFENRRVSRISPSNVMSLKTWRGKQPLVELERTGEGWILKNGNRTLGSGSIEATKYVNRAANLLALKIYSGDSPCGKPAQFRVHVVGISDRQEEWKFIPAKEGFLVCNSQRSDVYVVHKDIAKYLNVPAKKLM